MTIFPMKTLLFLSTLLLPALLSAQGPKTREQIPNLDALPDSTAALQRQIDENGGDLLLEGAKVFRITKPLLIDLTKHGATSVKSAGGATIVMDGPGPALQLIGSHEGTASPKSFQPKTWNERMPIVTGIEILGAHPEADGIRLVKTVGAIVSRVSVRWCRHGIHLVERNRNTVVSDCHLYENSGVGLFLDDVNLHQINVSNSHISYNRQGGIVVRDGNVRNLQVSGCDIEGNMPADETPTKTANILIDVSGSPEDKSKSIAEVAITGCTIQHSANYGGNEGRTVAPGGANIRLAGKDIYDIDSVTISGNVISDTTTNIDIDYAHDVAITANTFFAPKPDNLRVSNSQRVVVSGNTFNPRQFSRPGTILFRNCSDCVIANSTLHRLETDAGALILRGCEGFTINALNLSDCGSGIVLKNTLNTTISNCRVSRTAAGGLDLSIGETNRGILLNGNAFSGKTLEKQGRQALLETVELDLGKSTLVRLSDGTEATVKLLNLNERLDNVTGAVREATVTVEVNGERAELTSATYHLPQTVGGVQIDCPVTKGYIAKGTPRFWGLEKDARLRLWPAGSPWVAPRRLCIRRGKSGSPRTRKWPTIRSTWMAASVLTRAESIIIAVLILAAAKARWKSSPRPMGS